MGPKLEDRYMELQDSLHAAALQLWCSRRAAGIQITQVNFF
jgi:hypothetical protein